MVRMCAGVPAHNTINKWLGERVQVLQQPGRGIVRHYSNKQITYNGEQSKMTFWLFMKQTRGISSCTTKVCGGIAVELQ